MAASDPILAIFFDGRTPQTHHAHVSAEAEGLKIVWEGGEALWPWAAIERRDGGPGEARLSLRRDEGARLTLAASDWAALKPAKAGKDGRVSLKREALIGLACLGAAGVVFALLAFGVPAGAAWISRWTPVSYEARMGAALEDQVQFAFPLCPGEEGEAGDEVLTRLAERLAASSGSRFPMHVSVVRAPFPNAFALPGGRLMVTSELIEMAQHSDEVAGVLAHEIAHVAERHVIKGYVRSYTLGAVMDLVVGGGSGASAPIAAGIVNATALRYSREDEAEADARAVDYLREAGLDPASLARFFDRLRKLEQDEDGGLNIPEMLRTHPDTARRAEAARRFARPGAPAALSEAEWAVVKRSCSGKSDAEDGDQP